MKGNIDFAIDKNLNLAVAEPKWQRFFQKFHIVPSFYTDMKVLTGVMRQNRVLLSYLPTGNYFYFRSDPFYTPIANAIFSATNTTKIDSLLVVRKDSLVNTLADLRGKSYGYIHPFCTSSYFSIALLLWRHGFPIDRFFSSVQEVGPWQSQIDAVISGKIEATMVSEDVWRRQPMNAKKTKIIAVESGLPSPLILVGRTIEETLLSELKDFLFSYKTETADAMFNGFIPFQKKQTEKFFSESEQALRSLTVS